MWKNSEGECFHFDQWEVYFVMIEVSLYSIFRETETGHIMCRVMITRVVFKPIYVY